MKKELSPYLFDKIIQRKNLQGQRGIVINFSKVLDKVTHEEAFKYCRKVFHRNFHFDPTKTGSGHDVFNLKEYPYIVDSHGHDTLFGSKDPRGYSDCLWIKASDLLEDTSIVKTKLQDTISFDKNKI